MKRGVVHLLIRHRGVRLQGYKGANLGNGEMRRAGLPSREGEPFEPVGFWIEKSW